MYSDSEIMPDFGKFKVVIHGKQFLLKKIFTQTMESTKLVQP